MLFLIELFLLLIWKMFLCDFRVFCGQGGVSGLKGGGGEGEDFRVFCCEVDCFKV